MSPAFLSSLSISQPVALSAERAIVHTRSIEASKMRVRSSVCASRTVAVRSTAATVDATMRAISRRDELAVAEAEHAVGLGGRLGAMGNENDRRLALPSERMQFLEDDAGMLVVHATGGLVGEHEGRLVEHGAAVGDPLL